MIMDRTFLDHHLQKILRDKEFNHHTKIHSQYKDPDKDKIVNNLVSIYLYLFYIFLFISMVLCLF